MPGPAQMPGDGPTWIDGVVTVPTGDGEQLFAAYVKVRGFLTVYQRGLVRWDDQQQRFLKVCEFPFDAPLHPGGHAFVHTDGDARYVYFANPYPLLRVRADAAAIADLAQYEAFTCLTAGSRLTVPGKEGVHVERAEVQRTGAADPKVDKAGPPSWGWKKDAPAVTPDVQQKLIAAGKLRADEALLPLRDADTGRAVQAHGGSVAWNDYRKRYVMIANQAGGGSSYLGEVWYAEADTLLGPWVYARKVVTHDKYSFYNPAQHPEFAKDGGREIFFEGTYSTFFSGNSDQTPRYDYNQIMYKLALDDPRLALPVPVYRAAAGGDGGEVLSCSVEARRDGRIAFFALDRSVERGGTRAVPVYAAKSGDNGWRLSLTAPSTDGNAKDKPAPLFYAPPTDMEYPPATTAPLYEFTARDGKSHVYTTDETWTSAGYQRSDKPLCRVWKNPIGARISWP